MSSITTAFTGFKLPQLGKPGLWGVTLLAVFLLGGSGCGLLPKSEADAEPSAPRAREERGKISVDVAVASTGSLQPPLEYTGTTAPIQEVSVRSRAEGQLLSLTVDVGDTVSQSQLIARLDDALAVADAIEAEAELSARQVEVQRLETAVREAEVRLEQARLEMEQNKADAQRFQWLYDEGAVSQQQAEQAQTAALSAAQVVRAAVEQVRTAQQAVVAGEKRVQAQEAVLAGVRSRQSYTTINAPISGIVTQKVTEPGNLVQSGGEILKIGDFSRVKVLVQLSELELGNIQIGQLVDVRLDAFGDRIFPGQVTRISPAADPTARQVPIEITIPNENGGIGSGLLARVQLESPGDVRVIIPESALKTGEQRDRTSLREGSEAIVFVVEGEGNEATVRARQVILGEQADGRVEIRAGLEPGQRFVVRSGKPLKDGDEVQMSILSE